MGNDYITATRKIKLIPVAADNKYWIGRFDKYVDSIITEIKALETEKKELATSKDAKDVKRIKVIDTRLAYLHKKDVWIENYQNTGEICKELVNDYTYSFCRKACEEEAHHKNIVISNVISTLIAAGYSNLVSEEAKSIFKETYNTSVKTTGNGPGTWIDNPLGGYGISWSNELNSALKKDIFDGVLLGKIRPKFYKNDSPFTIAKAHMSFSHGYSCDEELAAHIRDNNAEVYLDLGKNAPTILRFRMNLGVNYKTKDELCTTIYRIFTGEYEHCGSSIQVDGSSIILNLTLKMPKKEMNVDKNIVLNVKLGIDTAIIGSIENLKKTFEFGTEHELEYYRTAIQKRLWELQRALKNTTGGHGREKKLQALKRYKDRERNYVKTFNHRASKALIDFAIANNAGTISMPDLTGFGKKKGRVEEENKYLLRNWSYYELQHMIEYKAERAGITVVYIKKNEIKTEE